jgi:hypothetical protein
VTVTVRSGHGSLSAHGFADTATHTADLTTQLPGGHAAELRYVSNEAYVHLAAPSIPWLSAAPSTFGFPVQVLWAAAAARHLSLKLDPQGDITVTVTMIPAAARAVRAPSGAINLTGNGRVLWLLGEHILGRESGPAPGRRSPSRSGPETAWSGWGIDG